MNRNVLNWWRKHSSLRKQYMTKTEFGKDKDFNTLTYDEIESLYLKYK